MAERWIKAGGDGGGKLRTLQIVHHICFPFSPGWVVLELKQNGSGALRVPAVPPEMPAEMGIVSPSQGRFAEKLCARHGSRHWGA